MNLSILQVGGGEDIESNKARVAEMIAEAAAQKADLALLPELSVLEFFPRKPHDYNFFDLAEPIPGPTSGWFAHLAKQHKIAIVYNHYERSDAGLYFDTSVVVDRHGQILGRQRMIHIAEEPGYNEKFYYAPGWDGYKVFEVGGWRFGIAICYDRHFPEVFRSFIMQGATMVLVPTAVASTEPFAEVYELEMRAAAVSNGVYIGMANRAGTEGSLTFLGQSMVIDPTGQVVTRCDADQGRVGVATLESKRLLHARRMFPFLRDRRPETYELVSRIPRGD